MRQCSLDGLLASDCQIVARAFIRLLCADIVEKLSVRELAGAVAPSDPVSLCRGEALGHGRDN
jgi:hypothetical protein